ncbi:hypothetical protein CASFOL_031460 [Castilleja foliolosa]|uniref:Uncharacterized protein n=1 Tax=Castilleja foliolosa TaxID=1961234 RepID=A0ABD3C5G5_9LAMI
MKKNVIRDPHTKSQLEFNGEMQLATVSGRIPCKDILQLFPVSSSPNFMSSYFPISVSIRVTLSNDLCYNIVSCLLKFDRKEVMINFSEVSY